MANNQSTIDKLAATNSGSMEFDGAVDAVRWLQLSPELPPPTIHPQDFGDTLGVALQWLDPQRTMWCRALFSGDGQFDWLIMGPPHDCLKEVEVTPSDVDNGAPSALVEYIKSFVLETA